MVNFIPFTILYLSLCYLIFSFLYFNVNLLNLPFISLSFLFFFPSIFSSHFLSIPFLFPPLQSIQLASFPYPLLPTIPYFLKFATFRLLTFFLAAFSRQLSFIAGLVRQKRGFKMESSSHLFV
jgi:hypothetical protein